MTTCSQLAFTVQLFRIVWIRYPTGLLPFDQPVGNRDLPVSVDYRSTTGLPSVSDRLSTVHRSATGYNLIVNRLPTAHRMPRLDLSHTQKTLKNIDGATGWLLHVVVDKLKIRYFSSTPTQIVERMRPSPCSTCWSCCSSPKRCAVHCKLTLKMKGGQALLFTGWCLTSVVWVMLSAVASPQYHAGELVILVNCPSWKTLLWLSSAIRSRRACSTRRQPVTTFNTCSQPVADRPSHCRGSTSATRM